MDRESEPVARIERIATGLRVGGAAGPVEISVCSPRIVRVARGGGGAPEGRSFVGARRWPTPAFDVADGETAALATSDLRVEVDRRPARLSFAGARGEWLLREPDGGGMAIERGPGGAARVRARFTFSGEQHFYGLGHGAGRLERLGSARQLWNSHLGHGPGSDIAIPLLVSSAGYALFFDNPSEGLLAVGRSDDGVRIDYTAEAGPLAWYSRASGSSRAPGACSRRRGSRSRC